jgi:hypothetical protein
MVHLVPLTLFVVAGASMQAAIVGVKSGTLPDLPGGRADVVIVSV